MPRRIPHKYPLPVNPRRLLQAIGASLVALILFSCEEYPYPSYPPGVYPHAATSGAYPRPAPAGWWNDDDASGSAKIVVHIGEQKAYFYKGKRVVGETTVSTGKPGFSTPPGHYTVLSKDAGHVSTVFGDYVDDYGNVVRSNVDSRKDARPKGSHFDGARMPYAMFFRGGYAMHQGYVPPFAASHGCIRLPGQMAVRFFENAPVGTPVTVTE
jgi:lipoprotein-anchoring transpeptidase ErfK/SrfK